MASARSTPIWADRICLAVVLAGLAMGGSMVYSQATSDPSRPATPSPGPLLPDPVPGRTASDAVSPGVPTDARPIAPGSADTEEMVVQVRVTGNGKIPLEKILPHIRTRAGRPFQAETIEDDVRRLTRTHMFLHVKPYYQKTSEGRVVIFEVLERPMLHYVKYVGNQKIKKQKLEKEAGIKPGDSLDTFAVEEARRRLEEYYHGHGFPRARVTLVEGDNTDDRGVVFLINEGQKQRILWTDFAGNTIANDARLRTQIQSKPGFLWIFKGELDRKQIDEDINRLTAYYRSLGFFRARVGRELHFNEAENWVTVTYVIDEGPRYQVRNVSFIGNTKFPTDDLAAKMKLKSGQFFNQSEMKADVAMIQDTYGGEGYVFADAQADPRFLEEPGELDLVYNIREGDRFRVGKINVQIKGEFPHTRIAAVLNRMSIRPGDIVDIRELRASERRLRACGLFEVDPQSGNVPKIVFSPPDSDSMVARKPPSNARGQSPDPPLVTVLNAPASLPADARDRQLDLTIQGVSKAGAEPVEASQPVVTTSWSTPAVQPPAARLPVGGTPALRPATASAVDSPPSSSLSLDQAQAALVRLLEQSPSAAASIPIPADGTPPARVWNDVAPAVPAPSSQAPRSEVPLRGDFGRPGQEPIIRGQYSSDAGRSVPVLPRSSLWSPKSPVSFTPGMSQSSQPLPPPGGTALAPAPYTAGSQPAPATSSRSTNQVAPAPYVPPIDVYPGAPTIADAAPLLGAPPDEPPPLYIPLNPMVAEARTGRLMFSVGVNSEAGLLGSVIIDEQNFDIGRLPRGWEDIRNGVAFRGAGQRFRAEAVPGTELQRYTVSFQEPYLLDTNVSLSLSGYYYDRQYDEWTEQRIGGRVGLGYQFTPDLSGTVAFRGATVEISDPIVPTPSQLAEVLGQNSLYGFQIQLTRDTRDSAFLPTEGSLIEASVEQVIGSFQYPRFELDMRRYFLIAQRPDGSGRQVLSLSSRMAITGEDTPIYEHYFAGGFSTLRGFDFRGASPRELGASVGGEFMLLASAEYMFPITADDMIRGVVFVDSGTVEPKIGDWTDRYRVAPGFGLRITIPAMGPAPIALDLAFPISHERGDEIENFSFFVGFLR